MKSVFFDKIIHLIKFLRSVTGRHIYQFAFLLVPLFLAGILKLSSTSIAYCAMRPTPSREDETTDWFSGRFQRRSLRHIWHRRSCAMGLDWEAGAWKSQIVSWLFTFLNFYLSGVICRVFEIILVCFKFYELDLRHFKLSFLAETWCASYLCLTMHFNVFLGHQHTLIH